MNCTRFTLSLLLLVLFLCGCGGGPGYEIAPVTGKVSFKGKPLAKAHVSFAPSGSKEPGPASYGRTDAEGKFSLRIEINKQEGAVVGAHVVRISTLGGEAAEQSDAGIKLPKDDVPAKYNTNSTLTFTVPRGGTKEANFDLLP